MEGQTYQEGDIEVKESKQGREVMPVWSVSSKTII